MRLTRFSCPGHNFLMLWRIFKKLHFWPIVIPFECLVLNKETIGTIFIMSLVWRGPWLGIEPWNSRTRSKHSRELIKRRSLLAQDRVIFSWFDAQLQLRVVVTSLLLLHYCIILFCMETLHFNPLPCLTWPTTPCLTFIYSTTALTWHWYCMHLIYLFISVKSTWVGL